MKVAEFDYDLPEALIAQEPISPRDASRLMVISRTNGSIEHKKFMDLPNLLTPGDLLVFNQTRVIPARLIGVRDTGGSVEVVLLRRINKDLWECLVRPGKKMREGAIAFFGNSKELQAKVIRHTDYGGRVIQFSYQGIFEEVLDRLGEMPLPPYITKKLLEKERYQTVYAKNEGSAAAPTAGLHFTQRLFQQLNNAGIDTAFLTLHVGLGTFRPVKTEEVEEHTMHAEYFEIDQETAQRINTAKKQGRRVIAVGTTTIRTLETISDAQGILRAGSGWTDIFIYPGYKFKHIDGMITNFHLPKSSLLMLVSAFAGSATIKTAYRKAVEESYRFFSFGDAMLIL